MSIEEIIVTVLPGLAGDYKKLVQVCPVAESVLLNILD